MKNCTNCKYARWERTNSGRLHPSGDGRCSYTYKIPELPQAYYFPFGEMHLSGGYINRRQELKDHCVYFSREDKQP